MLCCMLVECPQNPEQVLAEVAPKGMLVVIVAEDEAMVRDLVVGVLQKAGFTVLPAADGLEALKVPEAFQARSRLL